MNLYEDWAQKTYNTFLVNSQVHGWSKASDLPIRTLGPR